MAELSNGQAALLRTLLSSEQTRRPLLSDEQWEALEAVEPGMAEKWLSAWTEWRHGKSLARRAG